MPECEVEFRCKYANISESNLEVINTAVTILIKKYGAVRANIRADIHSTTYAFNPHNSKKYVKRDLLGDHITFEVLDPKTGEWHVFHYYVIRSGKTFVVNNRISRNPRTWDPKPGETAVEFNEKKGHQQTQISYELD